MSLDDDLAPWVAEALDRGENPAGFNPRKDVMAAELAAARSVADWLEKREPDLSRRACDRIAGRIVASRFAFISWLREIGTPERARLRSEQTLSYSDEDALLERLAFLQVEVAQVESWLRQMKSRNIDYDPDDARADEDDRRLSVAHFDEAASANGPDLGTVA